MQKCCGKSREVLTRDFGAQSLLNLATFTTLPSLVLQVLCRYPFLHTPVFILIALSPLATPATSPHHPRAGRHQPSRE